LRDPPGQRLHQPRVRRTRPPDQVWIRAYRLGYPRRALQLLEPRECVRHSLEGQREGDYAAAVDAGLDLVLRHLGRLGVHGVHRALRTVSLEPITLAPPTVGTAEREHPRVLAGAVVVQLAPRIAGRSAAQLGP